MESTALYTSATKPTTTEGTTARMIDSTGSVSIVDTPDLEANHNDKTTNYDDDRNHNDKKDENDHAVDNDNIDNDDDLASLDNDNKGTLRLPVMSQRPSVPNCCAICLGSYEVGDQVIWSSNPECSHAFHSECILEWLIKMQPETPCPCCRQEFTDLETIRKEAKILWTGAAAFDTSAIRF
jgi:Ring finger domain